MLSLPDEQGSQHQTKDHARLSEPHELEQQLDAQAQEKQRTQKSEIRHASIGLRAAGHEHGTDDQEADTDQ
jgi:hypothetical protein